MPIQTGGDGMGWGYYKDKLTCRTRSPTRVETGIGFAIHPFIGMAMQHKDLRIKENYLLGLNKVLGSKSFRQCLS